MGLEVDKIKLIEQIEKLKIENKDMKNKLTKFKKFVNSKIKKEIKGMNLKCKLQKNYDLLLKKTRKENKSDIFKTWMTETRPKPDKPKDKTRKQLLDSIISKHRYFK